MTFSMLLKPGFFCPPGKSISVYRVSAIVKSGAWQCCLMDWFLKRTVRTRFKVQISEFSFCFQVNSPPELHACLPVFFSLLGKVAMRGKWDRVGWNSCKGSAEKNRSLSIVLLLFVTSHSDEKSWRFICECTHECINTIGFEISYFNFFFLQFDFVYSRTLTKDLWVIHWVHANIYDHIFSYSLSSVQKQTHSSWPTALFILKANHLPVHRPILQYVWL